MQIELTPTLIDMYRETFEGEVRPNWCWIVSGPAEASVLGSLAGLTVEKAYAVPRLGRKSRRRQYTSPVDIWRSAFIPRPARAILQITFIWTPSNCSSSSPKSQ